MYRLYLEIMTTRFPIGWHSREAVQRGTARDFIVSESIGDIFRTMQRRYGRCMGKYRHEVVGQVGWIFRKNEFGMVWDTYVTLYTGSLSQETGEPVYTLFPVKLAKLESE